MTKTTTVPKCSACQRRATHYRRYDMADPTAGVIHEFYRPACDECGNGVYSPAPRIPLGEVA